MDISLALADVCAMWQVALPAMFLGCYFGVVLKSGKFFAFFSKITRPIAVLGRLPEALGPFFILCLLNRYAANAMLAEFGKSGAISQRTLLAAYLMGALPTGIYFTIFYFSPLLIAGLGWKLGTTFIAINIGMSTAVTIIGLLCSRLFTSVSGRTYNVQIDACSTQSEKTGLKEAAKKAWRQFGDIALVFLPITLASSLLMHTPFVREIVSGLDRILSLFNLKAAGALVVIAGIPTIMAAIGVAGTMLKSGALSPQDIIFILLLASFFHNIFDSFSRVLPTNLSIFGAKTGGIVTAVGAGVYLAIVAAAAFLAVCLG